MVFWNLSHQYLSLLFPTAVLLKGLLFQASAEGSVYSLWTKFSNSDKRVSFALSTCSADSVLVCAIACVRENNDVCSKFSYDVEESLCYIQPTIEAPGQATGQPQLHFMTDPEKNCLNHRESDGSAGIGCIRSQCCQEHREIDRLCPGNDVCCVTADICNLPTTVATTALPQSTVPRQPQCDANTCTLYSSSTKITLHESSQKWTIASNICSDSNPSAHLLRIYTQQKMNEIETALSLIENGKGAMLWVDARDQVGNKNFTWADGAVVVDNTFFSIGHPQNNMPACLYLQPQDMKLADGSCESGYIFYCEEEL